MTSPLTTRLEKCLVALLAASFVLPLAAGFYLRIFQPRSPGTVWLRNATLSGVQAHPAPVPMNAATVRTGQFQLAHAQAYDTDFAGREVLIRLINELYFRLLRTAPKPVIVGPGSNLVEEYYPNEYCLVRAPDDALRTLADNLQRLQDFCAARGMAFTVVITPSKAAIMPETLPSAWLRRYQPGKRFYDQFIQRLRERGIHHVDGHVLTAKLKTSAPAPVFPAGGVHWGAPAALATANSLLENLAAQGLRVTPIRDYETRVTFHSRGQDKDMADLINTAWQLRYPVAQINFRSPPPQPPEAPGRARRPTLAMVGGSFTEKLVSMLGASRQFAETDFYFYYKLRKDCQADGDIHHLAEPALPVNFETDIFAADALVLEVNEQVLKAPHALNAFLGDALAALPDPHAARAAFHYESRFGYQWGDILSFDRDRCPVKLLTTDGLAPVDRRGAYTEKRTMSLRLSTPPAPTDMTLEIDGHPFLVDSRVPRQRARVKVNGRRVGEMAWDQPKAETRRLSVPRDCLQGSETVLEFEWLDAVSPASLGIGPDTRKLGLCLAALSLTPAASPGDPDVSAPESAAAYRWGETLSMTERNPVAASARKGFTPPGDVGSHTEGPRSILRLATGAAPRDVVLKVTAGAWLSPPRLTEQVVDVYVNRHAVGRWTWTDWTMSERTLTIPKGFLDGQETRVELRVNHPMSPADLGLSVDQRKLGVCVSSVCLQPK